MNLSDVIAFLFFMLIMIISIASRIYETVDRKRNPKKYEDAANKEEDAIRKILRDFDITYENEEEEESPARKRKIEVPQKGKRGRQPAPLFAKSSRPKPMQVTKREPRESEMDRLPNQVMGDFDFHSEIEGAGSDISQVESRHLHSQIEGREGEALVSSRLKQTLLPVKEGDQGRDSRGGMASIRRQLGRLPSDKIMVVLHEIYGPPKSLQ